MRRVVTIDTLTKIGRHGAIEGVPQSMHAQAQRARGRRVGLRELVAPSDGSRAPVVVNEQSSILRQQVIEVALQQGQPPPGLGQHRRILGRALERRVEFVERQRRIRGLGGRFGRLRGDVFLYHAHRDAVEELKRLGHAMLAVVHAADDTFDGLIGKGARRRAVPPGEELVEAQADLVVPSPTRV